jgi:hypothetical protein
MLSAIIFVSLFTILFFPMSISKSLYATLAGLLIAENAFAAGAP